MEYEIFRVEKELKQIREKYAEDEIKIREEAKKEELRLEEEYNDKVKSAREKLSQDIQNLDDKYNSALESRTKTLYSSYGLFDKVEAKTDVDGSVLMQNLQDQVDAFNDWQGELSSLSAKGLNAELIEELRDMGPSSIAQIKALNSMSSGELAKYATLWGDKHKQAKEQATKELENMRLETQSQIRALESETEKELAVLKTTWENDTAAIVADTAEKLAELRKEYNKHFVTLHADRHAANIEAQRQAEEANKKAVEALSKQQTEYEKAGQDMMSGLIKGIKGAIPSVVALMGPLATGVMSAFTGFMGIKSPSKVFMGYGRNIDEGPIVGLESYAHKVNNATEGVAHGSIDTLKQAMLGISDVVNGDVDPTIRPVLDLTDVSRGISQIDGLLTSQHALALGATINQNGSRGHLEEIADSLQMANATSNSKIVSAIESLEEKMSGLIDKVGQLQVVMDTGTLVGAIVSPMDNALGNLSSLARRGVM